MSIRPPQHGASLLQHITGIQAPWLAALWPGLDILLRVDDLRRQVWFAVGAQLALRPERVTLGVGPRELPAWLEAAHPRDILIGVGLGVPIGWRRALSRVGPCAMRDPAAYLLLFDILSEGGPGAKMLHHHSVVTEPLIKVLEAIEPAMRHRALVSAILNCQPCCPVARAREWSWRLRRLRIIDPPMAEAVEVSVLRGRAPIDLIEDMRVGGDLPFPEPPWSGSELLRPIRTPSELVKVAFRYSNCLSSRVACARTGRGFYYEYVGDPAMVMEIARDEPYGYTVAAVRLAENALPTDAHIRALERELDTNSHIFLDREAHVSQARA